MNSQATEPEHPVWRSMLFLPAHRDDFISKAHKRGAHALLAAYEQGVIQGKGAVAFEGKMIDAPVVARAKEMLRGTS